MQIAPDHNAPLRLFWWKGVPNFGDALSALVVESVSGREVVHSGPMSCDLLAIGSLIQVMRRKYQEAPKDGHRPVIWGAGLLHSVPRDFLKFVDVALVRGPVTAALLGLQPRLFGDPGLLADKVIGPLPERQDRVVLVPHHSMIDDPALSLLIQSEPAIELVDPRGDALDVCRRIASARHVIAASLHGLIVADACGVPSTWLAPGEQALLKYHDYAASIARSMVNPLLIEDVPDLLRNLRDGDTIAHAEGIARAREDLLSTFPAHFRAFDQTPRDRAQA
ncbi:polysaccharide pyruvyl transferase family protein [Lutimaribacter marinistellae]|uniref:Polysaccharide pyruvyl transferase family protein n=1 Tax=Lutimaribacter marinistellae TaxID=1820329 RepID=A0ABV7TLT4_9RHOB